MLLNDKRIIELAAEGLITPFEPSLVRNVESNKVISYGLSSYGYDIRLASEDFRIFRHIPGEVVDPKNFNDRHLESCTLHEDSTGMYFILPGLSYALGFSYERFKLPGNVTALCQGKSTLARCGIQAAVTPAEAGWEGFLTLEFSNSMSADCKIYAMEGVCQLLFFEGEPCLTTYAQRSGKYQNQKREVTLPKV